MYRLKSVLARYVCCKQQCTVPPTSFWDDLYVRTNGEWRFQEYQYLGSLNFSSEKIGDIEMCLEQRSDLDET